MTSRTIKTGPGKTGKKKRPQGSQQIAKRAPDPTCDEIFGKTESDADATFAASGDTKDMAETALYDAVLKSCVDTEAKGKNRMCNGKCPKGKCMLVFRLAAPTAVNFCRTTNKVWVASYMGKAFYKCMCVT